MVLIDDDDDGESYGSMDDSNGDVHSVQLLHKMVFNSIISSLRIRPLWKSRLSNPIHRLISLLLVCPILEVDVHNFKIDISLNHCRPPKRSPSTKDVFTSRLHHNVNKVEILFEFAFSFIHDDALIHLYITWFKEVCSDVRTYVATYNFFSCEILVGCERLAFVLCNQQICQGKSSLKSFLSCRVTIPDYVWVLMVLSGLFCNRHVFVYCYIAMTRKRKVKFPSTKIVSLRNKMWELKKTISSITWLEMTKKWLAKFLGEAHMRSIISSCKYSLRH